MRHNLVCTYYSYIEVEKLIDKAITETTERILKEEICRLDYLIAVHKKTLRDVSQ